MILDKFKNIFTKFYHNALNTNLEIIIVWKKIELLHFLYF